MNTRLDIKKTYKLFIGGKFPRSESGRYLPAKSVKGEHMDNYAHASRKDFREAVSAARGAFDGWNKATAYNRGQILYRAAEMLQNRANELTNEIARSTNASAAKAKREVTAAIDRLVHHSVIIELNIPSYRLETAKNTKKASAEANPSPAAP